MELNGEKFLRRIFHCRDRRFRARRDFKSGRWFEDAIAVAHPHAAHAVEQAGFVNRFQNTRSILALIRWLDTAPQFFSHQLHSITNAENGNSELENRGIAKGSARFIDRRRAARQDDSFRLVCL